MSHTHKTVGMENKSKNDTHLDQNAFKDVDGAKLLSRVDDLNVSSHIFRSRG